MLVAKEDRVHKCPEGKFFSENKNYFLGISTPMTYNIHVWRFLKRVFSLSRSLGLLAMKIIGNFSVYWL
jgi:hypothetical protein